MRALPSYENITAVLRLLEDGSLDRNSIAVKLGISLTSVRNTVSFLLAHKIVGEYKKKSPENGRNTGIIYLKNGSEYVIADILQDKIRSYVFGPNLNISHRFPFDIQDSLFIDDSFASYAAYMSKEYGEIAALCFLGDSVASDGKFQGSAIRGMKNIPFNEMIHSHFGDITAMTEFRDMYIPDDMSGTVAVVSDLHGAFSTTVLIDGNIISRSIGDPFGIGNTMFFGRSLNNIIGYSKNFFEYSSAIADFLHMLFCLIDTDRVYFSSGKFSNSDLVLKRATEKLMLKYNYPVSHMPKLIPFDSAVPEISVKLRRHIRDTAVFYLLQNS